MVTANKQFYKKIPIKNLTIYQSGYLSLSIPPILLKIANNILIYVMKL